MIKYGRYTEKLAAAFRADFEAVSPSGVVSEASWLIDSWERNRSAGTTGTLIKENDDTFTLLLPGSVGYTLRRKTTEVAPVEPDPEPVNSAPVTQVERLRAVSERAQKLHRAEAKVSKFSDALFQADIGTGRARTLRRELRIATEARDSAEHMLHCALVEAGLAVYDERRYGQFTTTYNGSQWSMYRPAPNSSSD